MFKGKDKNVSSTFSKLLQAYKVMNFNGKELYVMGIERIIKFSAEEVVLLLKNAQKLCIIPLEYGGEVLAYEFYCEYYGAEYYVYINAFDGDEERVMKVVSTTDEGNLTK